MAGVKGEVQKRGERRGQGVEKRPTGEAERDAARAEDRVPIDARTGEPSEHGLLERPDLQGTDLGDDRRGLADMADREPHDHGG